ncbi:MAG TPA: hypothetical protein VMA77_09020 [Solirubrobacteraceae bacterium]|nr:hypothetical protein [Solirubrobacteraceae bacterium]
MPEGLSPAEVGKEIAEHREQHAGEDGGKEDDAERRDRWISILQAIMLSFVAVLAAYSGYAAAKWGTESSMRGSPPTLLITRTLPRAPPTSRNT